MIFFMKYSIPVARVKRVFVMLESLWQIDKSIKARCAINLAKRYRIKSILRSISEIVQRRSIDLSPSNDVTIKYSVLRANKGFMSFVN